MRFGSCAYCHRVIAIVSGVRVCGSCHILDQRELVFESDQEIEEEDLMFRVIGPMRERMDGFFDRDEPFLIFEESDAYDSEGPPIFYHSDIDSTELYEEDEDPAFLIEEDDETSFMPGFEESDAYDSEGPPILYHSDIDSMELYDEDEDPRFLREIDDHDDHMFYIIRERLRLDTIDDASETLIRQLYHFYVTQFTAESHTTGATESQLATLKRRMLSPQELLNGSNECTICTEDYDDQLELTELPCHHEYHSVCIRQWLKINSSCPICRHTLATPHHSVEYMDDVD